MNVNAANEDMLSVSELKSTTAERERERGGRERERDERAELESKKKTKMKIHFDECSQINHINLMRPLDLIATFGGFV